MTEPSIIVNGIPLTTAQAMTVRVALTHGLGDDEHGQAMIRSYLNAIKAIHLLMSLNNTGKG